MHAKSKPSYSFFKVRSEVFYEHESLIAVFEEREVLELNQPDRDVVLVDEEASEQHEGNDQHWCECDCQLLIREDSGYDESVAATCAVDQNQDCHC
jgi:hypothetical protein